MVTEDDVRSAIKAIGDHEHFHALAFEHPDVLTRAAWQAIWLKQAAGMTGDITPTEAEVRATPAGRLIPSDEPALLSQRKCGCGGGACSPRPAQGVAS
jgi:hypothetical protein